MYPQDGRRLPRLFYWSENTADVGFETGIQRVVRRLGQGMAHQGMAHQGMAREGMARDRLEVVPIGWDDRHRLPKPLSREQQAALGIAHRFERSDPFADIARDDWLFIPEIPLPRIIAGVDVAAVGRAYGLRTAAIIHDLIPLKLARDYEPATVAHYEAYYRMFAALDLAIATTRHVAEDLRRHLLSRGLRVPETIVCPLPAELSGTARRRAKTIGFADGRLKLLTVSTWEPRKNFPRLLRAIERSGGSRRFELTIVGRRGNFPEYDEEVDRLAGPMSGVTMLQHLRDAELAALFDAHHVSVYPSWEEGFGLPILESLWLATPCLCHNGSSMAEVAPGGGTLMVDMTDETAIAAALDRLAKDPGLCEALTAEAVARPLATWTDYADTVARHLWPAAG